MSHRLELPPFDAGFKAEIIEKINARAPHFQLIGIRVIDLEPGYSRLELPVRHEITHGGGAVQGGIVTTLADSAIANATLAAIDRSLTTTSIELKINFIRPVASGRLYAEGWLIHLGRRTAVGEAEITTEEGKIVAKCLSSVMIFPGPSIMQDDPSEAGTSE